MLNPHITYFSVAIIMSQVLVLARQGTTEWSGFHRRPTFKEVVQAIENLGSSASKDTDVIISLKQNTYPYFPMRYPNLG